jgi:hypothetical protein
MAPAAVQSFANVLSSILYANPHSHSPSSSATALEIDRIRERALQVIRCHDHWFIGQTIIKKPTSDYGKVSTNQMQRVQEKAIGAASRQKSFRGS